MSIDHDEPTAKLDPLEHAMQLIEQALDDVPASAECAALTNLATALATISIAQDLSELTRHVRDIADAKLGL